MPERTYITALVEEPLPEKQTQLWEACSGGNPQCSGLELMGDGPADQWLRFQSNEVSGLITSRSSLAEYPEEDRWWGIDNPHFDIEVADVQLNIETEERVKSLADFISCFYTAIDPSPSLIYGLPPVYTSNIYNDRLPLPVDKTAPVITDLAELKYVPWLLGISAEMADSFGREKLLETPAWLVSELADGGVFIIASDDPFANPDTTAITDHLGIPDAWDDLWG